MTNKYTEAILTTKTRCNGNLTLIDLERALKLKSPRKVFQYGDFFPDCWKALISSKCNPQEYKPNLYCLLAALSDTEIEEIRAYYIYS